ncbi:hypothetical protein GCM10023203_15570 [Actinomycetospora straminea]|uniref:Uncharacterized protein n=1 Tax=Actinomycetospora straminea TaxID=663607 RepID=A0ABP9E2Y4_9PSEU
MLPVSVWRTAPTAREVLPPSATTPGISRAENAVTFCTTDGSTSVVPSTVVGSPAAPGTEVAVGVGLDGVLLGR